MPCALTSNAAYPDYLKKILKEIDEGDDEGAKACACKLVTPVTNEGCEILDEDNKTLAFPFCMPEQSPELYEGYISSIGLSYKQAMKLYWTQKPFNISFVGSGTGVNSSSRGSCSVNSFKQTSTDLVCGTSQGGDVSSLDDPGMTRRSDSGSGGGGGSYDDGGAWYFGVEFGIFVIDFWNFPNSTGVRAWIDKEAKKIYPIIYGYCNLSGCCGNPGAISGSISGDSLTVKLLSGYGGSGVVIASLS